MPGQVHDRLESGGFSVGGKLLNSINATLGATRVTSIEYTLAILRSARSPYRFGEIEDGLLRQKHCDEMVQRLLKANKKVCSGAPR